MKALVTGGNGFTGSHLVDRLFAEGIGVRCLVRPTSNRAWLQGKPVEFIECDDLGNAERVRQAVRRRRSTCFMSWVRSWPATSMSIGAST